MMRDFDWNGLGFDGLKFREIDYKESSFDDIGMSAEVTSGQLICLT